MPHKVIDRYTTYTTVVVVEFNTDGKVSSASPHLRYSLEQLSNVLSNPRIIYSPKLLTLIWFVVPLLDTSQFVIVFISYWLGYFLSLSYQTPPTEIANLNCRVFNLMNGPVLKNSEHRSISSVLCHRLLIRWVSHERHCHFRPTTPNFELSNFDAHDTSTLGYDNEDDLPLMLGAGLMLRGRDALYIATARICRHPSAYSIESLKIVGSDAWPCILHFSYLPLHDVVLRVY